MSEAMVAQFSAPASLLESSYQLLQPLDPLILAGFTRLRRDQHRLQVSNIVRQIDSVQHGKSLSNYVLSYRRNLQTESS
ncbi:hypothetical protein [Rhizobium ruizarguesonis]|uniref:hypothetical protein n=1 Tax=Rhizobium ruizarguesonis TaxID=2081791 RepID=UPI0013EEF620|nr:hypothetical protein [Rhizobium ruizarguesonis]